MKPSTLHTWFLLLLILFSRGITFAVQSEVDKLHPLISKESNDTTRINLLIQSGLQYSFVSQEQISCFKEVFDLSRKINYPYGLAFGHYYEVLKLWQAGSYDSAIDKCKRCIDDLDSLNIVQKIEGYPLAEIRMLFYTAGKHQEKFRYYSDKVLYYRRHGPIENTANCFHGIAGYYEHLADFDKAISYYMRAGDVYKSFDPAGYANEQQVIGEMYMDWGNLDKAEVYMKSGLIDPTSTGGATNNYYGNHELGDLYVLRNDYKRALQYYLEAGKFAAMPELRAINMVKCAAVHLKTGALDSAKFYLDQAQKIRQKNKLGLFFSLGLLEIDYNFYKYYIATGKETAALKSLHAALDEAILANYFPLILNYTNELHSYLLHHGDSLQALRYLVQYHALQDSINTMNTMARIASFEIEQLQQQKEIEIEHLQTQKTTQRNYYLIAGTLFMLIVLAILSRLRYKRKRDKEQLTSDFKKQLAQAETKALRAQMNPHFIFNSLNSINSFVMDQKHEIASDYLIKFSKLIRLILDNSRSETISIEKELETLKLYVLLEAARFDDRFKCVYHIAGDVDTSSIMIPPMLLQPFVENAIWHGLMQKEGEGTITVEIKKQDEEFLNISITDNGIGREKAAELKSKSATHKSHGLKVTSRRIEMMNRLNSSGAQVNIVDLKDEQGNALGTRVELIIPI